MPPIRSVLVLGGGSAGFIAALSLKIHLPHLGIAVLRSPDLGIIGVGESTTTYVPEHLHGYLGLSVGDFFRQVQPSWKLGIRFLWGPRPFYNYTFTFQVEQRLPGLTKPAGYFVDERFDVTDLHSALMTADRVFARQPDGGPLVTRNIAYHLENEHLVAYLEATATQLGIEIIDDRVVDVTRRGDRIEQLRLESGRVIGADFYVDCSGFRAELIGKALGEPSISFEKSLFNDRAIVGGWTREDEPVLPYTTAETMDAGWAWRIDHPRRINRGYVYCSSFLSDADAEAELRRKNPKIGPTRVVRFSCGRRERAWVGNVAAIGNSCGFVEPLESTSLYVICLASHLLTETLRHTDSDPGAESIRQFNRLIGSVWDSIRRFLAVHFRFNTRLDTPYWRACRADVDLAGAEEIVRYYEENGPQTLYNVTLLDELDPFRLEGYYTQLLGQAVPHRRPHTPSLHEQLVWSRHQQNARAQAESAFTVEEALTIVHSPMWSWNPAFYRQEADVRRSR